MDTNARKGTSTQTNESPARGAAVAAAAVENQNTAFGTSRHPEGFIETWRRETHWWRGRAVLCLFLSLLLATMQPFGNGLYSSWGADNMAGYAVADDEPTEVAPQAEETTEPQPAAEEPAPEPQPEPPAAEEPAAPAEDPAPSDPATDAPATETDEQPAADANTGTGDVADDAEDANNANQNGATPGETTTGDAAAVTNNDKNQESNALENATEGADKTDADKEKDAEADAASKDEETGKDKDKADAQPTAKNYGWLMLQADPATGQASAGAAILRDPATGASAASVANGESATAAAPFAAGFSADGVSWKVWKLGSPNYAGQAVNVTANLLQGAPTPAKAAAAAATSDAWEKGSAFYNDSMAKDGTMYIGVSPAFTVQYDANGGEGYLAPVVYDASVDTAAMQAVANVSTYTGAEFTREGYHLVGWALSPEAGEAGQVDIPLNADAAAIAEALGHAAAGAFNADGQLTSSATLYAAWAEGTADETYTYTYTLVRDAELADDVVVTVNGQEVTDEGVEVTIQSDVELTYEDALRQIRENTVTTVLSDEDEEAAADAAAVVQTVATSVEQKAEENGLATPEPAATKGTPTTTENTTAETTDPEPVEWEITEPADVLAKDVMLATGVVFSVASAEGDLVAQSEPPFINEDRRIFFFADFSADAPAADWYESWNSSTGVFTGLRENDNTYPLYSSDPSVVITDDRYVDKLAGKVGNASYGNLGAITYVGDLSTGNMLNWDSDQMTAGYWAWSLGYYLDKWRGIQPDVFWRPISGTYNGNSIKGYAYGSYVKDVAATVATNDPYAFVEDDSKVTIILPALGSPKVESNDGTYGEYAGKYYDSYLFALWTKRNDYRLSILGNNGGSHATFANGVTYLSNLSWDSEINIASLVNGSDLGSALKTLLLSDCDWAVCPVLYDNDQEHAGEMAGDGIYLLDRASLTENLTFGQLVNPGNDSDPKVDPYSKTSPYYLTGGANYLGWVSISPGFYLTYDANGGTGGSTSFFPADWSDDGADSFAWANLTDAEKTIKDGSVVSKKAEFLGWSLTDPASVERELVLGDVDISSEWLRSHPQATVFDALSAVQGMTVDTDDGLSTVSNGDGDAIIDSEDSIYGNLTLYAVWESTNTHEVTWNLVDEDGNTVTDAKLSGTDTEYSESLTYGSIVDGVTAEADGITDEAFAKKYGSNPTITWTYKEGATEKEDTDNIKADATITGTLALARYPVTVNAADGHFAVTKDGSDYEIKQIVVTGVPYGKSYQAATFNLADAAISGEDNDVLTVAWDKDGTSSISALADAGIGLGTYVDASGTEGVSGNWTGAWSADLTGTVEGATTLTYTYDKGYNKLEFKVADAVSNPTEGADATVQASQTTDDMELAFATVYVGYDNWTVAGIADADNWFYGNTTTAKGAYPGAQLKSTVTTYQVGDKYATVSDAHVSASPNYVAWSGFPTNANVDADSGKLSSASYELTATPTLREFEVRVTVSGGTGSTPTDSGGTVTKDGQDAATDSSQSPVVGTVVYGNYAGAVVNANVINGIVPSNANGYTAKKIDASFNEVSGEWAEEGDTSTAVTWSWAATAAPNTAKGTTAPAATQVKEAITYTVNLATKKFPVVVEVNGGTFNQVNPGSATETAQSFTIAGVPYNTPVTIIRYNNDLKFTTETNGTHALTNPSPLTAGDGRNTDAYNASSKPYGANWSSSIFEAKVPGLSDAKGTSGNIYDGDSTGNSPAAILKNGVTLKYEFGRNDIPVEYTLVGGKWSSNSDATISGTVPYGLTIADGSTEVKTVPDPTSDGAVTVDDANHWFSPSLSGKAGAWDTTPTADTVINSSLINSSTNKATFTYELKTRDDLTVTYTIPSSYASEVEFDGASSFTGITYNAERSSVAAAPSAIKAKAGVDATMVSKKYNLTGFTWNTTLASNVTSDLSYEAQITQRDYKVTYAVENGTWYNSTVSTDSKTDYHYGESPSTSVSAASQGVAGNTSENIVKPNNGYEKSTGAWEGVWQMRVSNDGGNTWSGWSSLTDEEGKVVGTPSAVFLTGDTQFKLTLKRVVPVTFNHDTDTISSGFTNVGPTEYFAGDTLTAPTINDADLTAKTGYEKSSGSTTKLGHWTTDVPATVPDSETALTYTYALYPVYTATYYIANGEWDGTWHGSPISGAGTQKEELFSTESITLPGSKSKNAGVYNLPRVWYEGANVTSGTAVTPSGTLAGNVSYTAYYGSNNTYTYTVEFYEETIASAKSGGAGTASNYALNSSRTYTSDPVAPGTKVGVTAAILSEKAPTPAAAWQYNNTLSAPVLTSAAFTETIEGPGKVFKVYYDRKSFNVTYQYTYPDNDSDKFSGLPTVPATVPLPYGDTLTADPTAASTDYYTFGGWKYNDGNVPSTMPAGNITLTGAWTRNPVTLKLTNAESGKGTVSATTGTADGITVSGANNDLTITGYKYGDTVTWPSDLKHEAISGVFFAGWENGTTESGPRNIGNDLPTTIESPTMAITGTASNLTAEFKATWNTGIQIQYLRDLDGVGEFVEQDSGYLNPDADGNVVVPSFATTLEGDVDNDPTTKHKAGYTFTGWEWTDGTLKSSTSVTDPAGNGTPGTKTNRPLTFRAVYAGTVHAITYDVNGGTQNTSDTRKLEPGATDVTRPTGAVVYLPSSTELTRTGCTLKGYSVKVGQADAVEQDPGEYVIPAGAAGEDNAYTDAITITALWDTSVVFSTSAPDGAGLASTGIPAAVSASNTDYAKVALGTTVTLPAADSTVISQVGVNPGYHFAGWTNNAGLTLAKNATEFTVPSAADASIPSDGITVTANWEIDSYTVHWVKSSDSVYDDVNLTRETDSQVNYGKAGSAVQSDGTAPTLTGTDQTVFNAKYTSGAAGVDWYLKVGDGQTKVKLSDITFGTDFYYNGDGVCDSTVSDAVKFEWIDASSATNGKTVTFVAVPKITQYTITVAVTNGTMTNPHVEPATTGVTSVSYTRDYGTAFASFLPSPVSLYNFQTDSTHVQSSGKWESANPFEGSLTVTQSDTYTYSFPTKRSYKVVYKIATPTSSDAWYGDTGNIKLTREAETPNPEIGSAYNTSSFPTLAADGTWTADDLAKKYKTALTWKLSGADVTSGTYADSMINGSEDDWPKTIEFIGTPQTKTYTVRVSVRGGSFAADTDVVSNVRTESTNAVYGTKLSSYLPTVTDATTGFTRDADASMATGHWEYNGTTVDPNTDTVQYEDATYTYVFDTKRTITLKVSDVSETIGDQQKGGFANGNPASSDGYFTKTYYVRSGGTLLDAADPADTTGAKVFASEADLQAAYKLLAQGSGQGYQWNTAGWASTVANTLTTAQREPDETAASADRSYPSATATITSDVTFTYDYAAKPVTVTFIQMFQDASGDGYSQLDTATEGVKHTAVWNGSYSPNAVTIADWSGRLLNATDSTLKGYKVTPVKATSDSAGATEITTFEPRNFTDGQTYYLWYDRMTVNYSYSYTNAAPASASTTPTGGSVRWGGSADLADPRDDTFALSLNGWYTKNPFVPADLASAPGGSYTFQPDYSLSSPPESINVTLYGQWRTASYPVTFENAGTDDPNDKKATFTLNGTTYEPTLDGDNVTAVASATTGAITYDTEIGAGNVPQVTVSFADKYSFVGWNLYINGELQTDADGKAVLYTSDEVAAHKVMRSNYVYKPVFKLNQITITLNGNGHQDGLDGIDGYTTWTVDYGSKVQLPNDADWTTYKASHDVSSWLDANNKLYPFTEDQYAVRPAQPVTSPNAWVDNKPVVGEESHQWPSDLEDGHYYLVATENLTYYYQWDDIKFTVYYMNVGGSTSTIQALEGKRTTETLTWNDSVFDAKLSDNAGDTAQTVRNTFGKYAANEHGGVDKVLYPEWSGHDFLGWQQGSATKAGRGVIVSPGGDITVSAAYNPSYVSAGQYVIYLWARWLGDSQTVTFHKNDGAAAEETKTQDIEIDLPTKLTAFNEMTRFARDGYTFNGWTKEANKNTAWGSVAAGDKWEDTAAYTVQETSTSDDLNLYANWTPNTYKVQFAYFDGTVMSVNDVTGSGSTDDAYQQTFTYGTADNLCSTGLAAKVNATGEHNPAGDTFAGWSYNGATLADGASVSDLTAENGGVVTLTPVAASSIKLTYDANAGTDTVTDMPSPATTSAFVITDSASAVQGYAEFTLPGAGTADDPKPARNGYEFAGWKVPGAVDAAGAALTGVLPAGTKVYLSGTYAAYLAYAQWTASATTSYTIERQVQSAPGSNTYTVKTSETRSAPTGSWVEIGVGDLASYSTSLEGYTYMAGLSSTGTYVTPGAKIILKYNVDAYTLTYAFTEGGLALTGDAAGSTPFGTNSTVAVSSADESTTLPLPTSATLPAGYQIAAGHANTTWAYAAGQNSLRDTEGNLVAAGTVNGATAYKVIGDTTLTLPIEKQKFTVTFKLGQNAQWASGSATGDISKANVVYGTSVDPDDAAVGASVAPVAATGFGFSGWTYANATNAADPKNGTIVDPATTAITGDITFTANYFPSYTVSWAAGGNSASGFSHTDLSKRVFTALPAEGYVWTSDDPDATESNVAGLQLADDDLFAPGVPLAEDGYQFASWKVSCAADIVGEDGSTLVNGTTYTSLDALYAALVPQHDYVIEATWEKLTQTVIFDPNTTDGAKAGELPRALQGLSGSSTLLDGTAAKAPAAPQARAGYSFDYWQLGSGETATLLNADEAFTFPMNPLALSITTYVAHWSDAIIDINTAVSPAGRGTVTQNRATTGIRALSTDVEYTLKANPQPGWKFDHWATSTDTDISSWYRTNIADKANSEYGLLTIQPVDGAYEAATYTAVFVKDPYQVTFQNSATPGEGSISVAYADIDGRAASYELVDYNGNVSTSTVSATASTPGYRFLGWTYEVWPETADEDGVLHTATTPTAVSTPVPTEDLGSVPIVGRTVFTALYAKNAATLTYDKNADAATGSIGQVTGKFTGDVVTLPSEGFTWAGHTLLGWAAAAANGDKPAASMTPDEFAAYELAVGLADGSSTYALKGGPETLYAVYEAQPATLVYDNNATTIDGLAKASSKGVAIKAGESATALTVAAVNWENGDTLATQPGYITDDASATRVPGAAREFVGWSFNKDAAPGGTSTIFQPGDEIPATYLPNAKDGTVTIYAIWQDKTFTVSLGANGGSLKSGVTDPNPVGVNVRYGEVVSVPQLPYERRGHTFRYWLANDGAFTRVSDSTGAPDSYTFVGTSDVTLLAQWVADSTVTYKATLQLKDENGNNLTSSAMGPYSLYDRPLSDGAYENLSVTGTSPLVTEDTRDYFTFEGWYIYNTLNDNQKVSGTNVEVEDIVKMYNGAGGATSLPVYWDTTTGATTELFDNNTTAQNLLTLYAKKALNAYDISFAPNVPAGSDYAAADVTPATVPDVLKAKTDGTETRTIDEALSLRGYTFLGWLTSAPSSAATTTQTAFNTAVSGGSAVNVGYSLATPLLAPTSTSRAITLYAAWADTDNSVTFVQAYDGDGVRAADAGTDELVLATQTGKTWKAELSSVTAPATHPENEFALFTGWYTEHGVRIDPATCKTVADILAADPSLTASRGDSFDIKLYAQYSFKSARVVYNGDADATAPATLPTNQAVEIPETAGALPAAAITPVMASQYQYQKAGFHMDGWEGRNNDGAYDSTDVAGGYYNKAILDTDADRRILFDYDAAGMVVNLYPHYAANEYTVTYNYQVPDGYSSYVMSSAVPGKNASGGNVMQATAGWSTGSVYARDLFATDPVLEGYDLSGFTYTTLNNKTVTVQRGWTTEDLVNAIAAADPADPKATSAKYGDSAFELKAVWTPKTFSVAYDPDGGVLLSTGLAPSAKTNVAWDATADAANDRLLIEAAKLTREGYSNPVWYVDSAKGTAANSGAGGDAPTFGQLVYLWHQANHHASGTNIFTGAEPLTLHAGWDEDAVTILFMPSDAENGWVTSVSVDGSVVRSYTPHDATQVAFYVGARTGKVTVEGASGDVETTIDKVSVAIACENGYSVTGWTFGTETVATGNVPYSVPASATRYVGGTYEAQVVGDPSVGITLNYYDMNTSGAYPATPSATSSGLQASDFLNAAGGTAKVGDVIPAAQLGAVRVDTPAGLSLDTGALADYTVKVSGNTVDLHFKRATADVAFTWEWPDGKAAAKQPALPADYLSVYYGSSQATPAAPTAPDGYQFDGWYKQGSDTALGSTFTVDDLDGETVVGKFSKKSIDVTFTGVYEDDGTTRLTGDDIPTVEPATMTTEVEFGSTVGKSKKIVLTDVATENKVQDVTLGKEGGLNDFTVSYDSGKYSITWAYSKDGGTTWLSTSDPTAVKIESATEFRVVATDAQTVSYLAGDHGTFVTTTEAGTRADGVGAPFDMADYLYDEESADGKKVSAGPLGADGLPVGEPGWAFTGWTWQYALASGYMAEGSTPEFEEEPTPAQLMHAGVEDLAGLVHGIALTAQWEPAESYLLLDLNDQDIVFDNVVLASYASGYTSPQGLQPTYDEALSNAVTLPAAEDVQRNGFTLKGWTWDVDGTTYEYAPGAEFQMPGSDKTTAYDPAVTLKAVWAEDYVTINYYSNDNAKGTVSVSTETIGTWTGNRRGTATQLSGSDAQPTANYNFTKWTRDSVDGTEITDATGLRGTTIVPQRNTVDKRYDAVDYYATFTGDMYYVTFIVDSASASMGRVQVSGFSETTGQRVPYGSTPIMSGMGYEGTAVSVQALTNGADYDFADGRYWDYYVNTGTTSSPTWEKKGSTTDPSTVTITADTQFRVKFKKSTGKYPVHFDTRGGVGTFDTVYKAWGDANVGSGKTPRRYGYEFNGWYATPYGQTFASATDAIPGMLAAISNTYGQLVGSDTYATRAMQEGVTLLAGWRELGGFAITLNGNGGTFVDPTDPNATVSSTKAANYKWTNPVSSRISASAEPSRPGYEFAGWATSPNGAVIGDDTTYADLAGTNDTAPGGVTLYAQWTERTYAVKYVNWPESNDDPITESGDTAIVRHLKYNDVVAMGEPYNSKDDDRAWNCWKVKTGTSTQPDVSLTGAQSGWTVAYLEANNVSGSGTEEDPYMVYATWTDYVRWTTTYILYEFEVGDASADAASWEASMAADDGSSMGDEFANAKHVRYLTITDKGLPGDWATPNRADANMPPGFRFSEFMTVGYNRWQNPSEWGSITSTDDMKVEITETTVNLNFDVVALAKNGYTVAFDLNDDNMSFPGGYTHAAVPGTADGSAYPSQDVLDYYNIHNIPWTGYVIGGDDDGVATPNPTRAGFLFDGWYNLPVRDDQDIDADIDYKAAADTYYGDLTYDAQGEWYDPMKTSGGVLTLFAHWVELQRTVRYIVADDMKDLVTIRLNSEDDSAFSLAERTEVIGAATGDVFVDGTRSGDVPQGATAKAKRGYSVEWRIVSDASGAASKTYSMPLGTGSSLATAAVVSELQDRAVVRVLSEREAAQASEDEAALSVQVSDTAMSTDGKLYSPTTSITPGVDTASGLFVGAATGEADPDAANVLYVAVATLNETATITVDPGEGTYSGPATFTQPVGTYIGESEPWGEGDGALPAASTIVRPGYTFKGWVIPAGTQYVDAQGNTQTFAADTTVYPTDDVAKRIIVPEGGLTLKAAWEKNPPDDVVTHTVTIPETTLSDGTVVPGLTLTVEDGAKLTSEQIEQIINRGGSTPDKWVVTYYDPDTGTWHNDEELTTDQLRALLRALPISADMTIKPSPNAHVEPYTPPSNPTEDPTDDPKDPKDNPADPTNPGNPSNPSSPSSSSDLKITRPTSDFAAVKTGDMMNSTTVLTLSSCALSALVLMLFLSLRRREEDDR